MSLSSKPILAHQSFSKPFILDTNASSLTIAGILSKRSVGKEHVIAYASTTLTKATHRYCVIRKKIFELFIIQRLSIYTVRNLPSAQTTVLSDITKFEKSR